MQSAFELSSIEETGAKLGQTLGHDYNSLIMEKAYYPGTLVLN